MLTYVLDVGDIADVRFVLSPLTETALSLFHLGRPRSGAPHLAGWRTQARAADGYDRALIDALVSRSGSSIPDFLTPIPATTLPRPSFEDQLASVAATDPSVVRRELDELREGGPASPALAALLDDDRAGDRIAEEIARYHRAAIAPHWSSVVSILEADVTHRARELAEGGVARLFASLTPRVAWNRDGRLRIDLACRTASGEFATAGRGLTLLPSVFVGRVTVAHDPARTAPHIGYPARGTAAMGEWVRPVAADALRRLVGPAKADVLAALEQPTSVGVLARTLGVSPSAVSQSLRVLHANGLVDRARQGRRMLYRRTALGDGLFSGGRPTGE